MIAPRINGLTFPHSLIGCTGSQYRRGSDILADSLMDLLLFPCLAATPGQAIQSWAVRRLSASFNPRFTPSSILLSPLFHHGFTPSFP